MWRDALTGALYAGDCRPGDRAATAEEVTAWNAARAAAVPDQVRALQLIEALDDLGHLAAVKEAVTAAGGLVPDIWLHASLFERTDARLCALGAAAGLSPEDIDAVFRLAATK
jgi:hypothetical protein